MRFLATFAAAFVSALVVAFAILPFGLQASWAVPVALLCGALASGLGAWLADAGRGRLAAVLAASLASLVVAVPVAAVLVFAFGASLSIATPIVLAVVAATSALAVRRGSRGPARPSEGRAGLTKIVLAASVLAVVFLLLLPVGELGYTRLTSCVGEERAVFEEFPQYSPRVPEELDPRPDDPDVLSAFGDDACVVSYRTPEVATQVIAYFEGRLKEDGWEVLPPGTEGAAVYARRGGYEYRVSFSGNPTSAQEGTPVSVVVWKP